MLPNLSFTTGAKINLGLSVLGLAPGGYHQVTTILFKLPLTDTINIVWSDSGANSLTTNHPRVPTDQTNLICRALKQLQSECHLPPAEITLQKNVPVGAGLGGGSFNAGGLLQHLNQTLNLGLSRARLQMLALTLGADVPFAARPEVCSLEQHHGLPDLQVSPLPALPPCQIALQFFPQLSFSARQLYQRLDRCQFQPADQTPLLTALKNHYLTAIAAHLNNDFGHYVFAHYPQIKAARKRLLAAGALGVNLSGKGPTLFALFPPRAPVPPDLMIINNDPKGKHASPSPN